MVEGTFLLDQKQLEKVEATITVTMTMEQWSQIHEYLEQKKDWPFWKVASVIGKLLSNAQDRLYETQEANV